MIKHLLFNENSQWEYKSNSNELLPSLTDLSKVNIFVGPNNSGKSRLVRKILPHNYLTHAHVTGDPLVEVSNNIREGSYLTERGIPEIIRRFSSCIDQTNGSSFLEIFLNIQLKNGAFRDYPTITEAVGQLSERNKVLRENKFLQNSETHGAITDLLSNLSRRGGFSSYAQPDANAYSRIYIPLLRGLRPLIRSSDLIEAFGDQAHRQQVSLSVADMLGSAFGANQTPAFDALNDLYKKATLRDYPELRDKVNVHTGLSIYWDVRKLLLGNENSRKRVANFQSYLRDHFFEGQEVELVPQLETPGTLHINIGKSKDFAIHDLGDGIQAIISLLYPLFTQLDPQTNALIGIEEPENNLHPGLQRQFLEALNYFKNAQFFITTHSNHLIESVEEVGNASIYRVENASFEQDGKNQKYARISCSNYGDFQTLESLGVMNTSVFLSNCTIWVEGPTDRRIFRHYLRLYIAHLGTSSKLLIEDRHYSFVEYGGSNITHFSVLDEDPAPINVDHLCGKLLLIADQDNATGKKAARHSYLTTSLADRFIVLGCKEVENLCSPEVITKIVKSYLPEGSEYIFKSKWETYSDKPLGKCIDDSIQKGGHQMTHGKTSFSDHGTIRSKVAFCNLAIANTESWEDLTEEAKRVTRIMHSFIVRQNFPTSSRPPAD